MTFKKPVGPDGTIITMVEGKAGSVKVRHPQIKVLLLIDLWGENGGPQGAFLENTKIENGTKIDQWRQDWHRDPLTINGNSIEKSMIFEGSKP